MKDNTDEKFEEINLRLMEAVFKCNPDLQNIQQLLDDKADVTARDSLGISVLGYAYLWDVNSEVMPLLLAAAPVDLQSKLKHATIYGKQEVVRLLLAPVDLQNKDGDTALMATSRYGEPEMVRLWLEAGACVDLQNKKGDTALMVASGCAEQEVVRLLLEAGARVDLQNKKGDTALMEAIKCGEQEVTRLLLKAGACVDLQNKKGETALKLAYKDEIRAMLKAAAEYQAQALAFCMSLDQRVGAASRVNRALVQADLGDTRLLPQIFQFINPFYEDVNVHSAQPVQGGKGAGPAHP